MHPGDQPTNDDLAYATPTLQTTLFPLPESHPLPIREFLTTDQPRHRLAQQGAADLSDAELLAVIMGVPCLETAGYTMAPHAEDDDAEGRCDYEQQTISVQAGAPARMLHILIHELAHALTAAIRQAHDRTERETIAEGVAFVACAAIGLDAGYTQITTVDA